MTEQEEWIKQALSAVEEGHKKMLRDTGRLAQIRAAIVRRRPLNSKEFPENSKRDSSSCDLAHKRNRP